MKYVILAVLMAVTMSAQAGCENGWVMGGYEKDAYYLNENGYVTPYEKTAKYIEWQNINENGYLND